MPVVILFHIPCIEIFGFSAFCIGCDYINFAFVLAEFIVVKRIFAVAVAELSVNIIKVKVKLFFEHIVKAHIFFSESVFVIKIIISSPLSRGERSDICASC